jgi:hypothetical protein
MLANICLYVVGISFVQSPQKSPLYRRYIPSSLPISILCIGLHLLDVADLAPLLRPVFTRVSEVVGDRHPREGLAEGPTEGFAKPSIV